MRKKEIIKILKQHQLELHGTEDLSMDYYCKSSVAYRIAQLRREFEVFKKKVITFD